MDIPRGHAMLPLNDADFLDFIYNYFKAEYAPIRSFWSTATAEPRQTQRWVSMGHELAPLGFRPANAQAQKDLESLDYFVRQKNLDASFLRGIVIRFAKYEIHERLEKKLYESYRLDLMVRKALKEKHLIDAIWPSPAPRSIQPELLQQGVRVRQWYGDMFTKYFRHLRSVDDFGLKQEVDARIKSSGTLMLVPYVDHLVFGAVDPIMPIIAKGAGYANSKAWQQKGKGTTFGEPDRFEIRFDAPPDMTDTHTKSVVRQCQCMKCGTKRDVTVVISVDPSPKPASRHVTSSGRGPSKSTTSAPRHQSKTAQKYSPGYIMPGSQDTVPRQHTPQRTSQPTQAEHSPVEARPPSPPQKKQCPRCTFLNHPDLTSCEMCQADLPETLVSKPPSPELSHPKSSHSHTVSLPPPTKAETQERDNATSRPAAPNRHSLSSTLFSIFPFSQQEQSEHHPKLPPAQRPELPARKKSAPKSNLDPPRTPERKLKERADLPSHKEDVLTQREDDPLKDSPNLIDLEPPAHDEPQSQRPEMAMMPLTPSPSSSHRNRQAPAGMPQNLMDDFVPVSPAFPREEEDEDAGWGEMSKEEAKDQDSDDDDDDEGFSRGTEGMVDLDAVAREEKGVWGD